MKIVSLTLVALFALNTLMASDMRELPAIKGTPQIIQSAELLPKLKLLSEGSNISDKQLLIDYIEYSFNPHISDEMMTLEELIPALGLAADTMGELEVPLIVFSILESKNQIIKNRLSLLLFKVTKEQPASYLEKTGISIDNGLAEIFAGAEAASKLEEMAFFEGFTENPKMLEFLNKLDNPE